MTHAHARVLEFWPDHGPGPLWADGVPADLTALGLPGPLVERLRAFNAGYQEHRLPLDDSGDPDYIAVGGALLGEVRSALAGRYTVIATEPWWETPPQR